MAPYLSPRLFCQSLRDDDTPCGRHATKEVKGRPGFLWSGLHCDEHGERVVRVMGPDVCVVTDLEERPGTLGGMPRTGCCDGPVILPDRRIAFRVEDLPRDFDGLTCSRCGEAVQAIFHPKGALFGG